MVESNYCHGLDVMADIRQELDGEVTSEADELPRWMRTHVLFSPVSVPHIHEGKLWFYMPHDYSNAGADLQNPKTLREVMLRRFPTPANPMEVAFTTRRAIRFPTGEMSVTRRVNGQVRLRMDHDVFDGSVRRPGRGALKPLKTILGLGRPGSKFDLLKIVNRPGISQPRYTETSLRSLIREHGQAGVVGTYTQETRNEILSAIIDLDFADPKGRDGFAVEASIMGSGF